VLASSIFNGIEGIEESHTISVKSDADDEALMFRALYLVLERRDQVE
jgi:hypothetical protein